jgi:hypothetical protein
MQARMRNPGVVIPDAMTATRALNEPSSSAGYHRRPTCSVLHGEVLARRPHSCN